MLSEILVPPGSLKVETRYPRAFNSLARDCIVGLASHLYQLGSSIYLWSVNYHLYLMDLGLIAVCRSFSA